MFGIGSVGMINEEFFRKDPNLYLLLSYLAIFGIPAIQGLNWLSQNGPGDSSSSLPPSDSSSPSSSLKE